MLAADIVTEAITMSNEADLFFLLGTIIFCFKL